MRLPDAREDNVLPDVDYGDLQGGYWRSAGDKWMCGVPALDFGLGDLSTHNVTEHEDGTITVWPSILVVLGDGRRWHGFLKRGVWRALDDCVLERPT